MAVVIPNYEDSPSFDAMAVRDRTDDFAARSDSLGTGVVSGMAVTQNTGTGTDMTYNVASGVVSVLGVKYTYAGGTGLGPVGAANTADRRDVIVYRVGTGILKIAGTPSPFTTGNWVATTSNASPPVKPNITEATDVVLAEIYVASSNGSNTTVITTATNIVDKRNVLSLSSLAVPALVSTYPLKTGTYTAAVNDLVLTDSSGGTVTITLPTAPPDGSIVAIKTVKAGNPVVINTGGTDVISQAGTTSFKMKTAAQGITFQYTNAATTGSVGIWIGSSTAVAVSFMAPNNVTAQSTTYTAAAADIVLCTAGSGGFVVTLPTPTINAQILIKKVDTGAGTITITPASGTVDGAASYLLITQYDSILLVGDGTNWFISNAIVDNLNIETVIRKNSLNQLAPATGVYSMGGFRLTTGANAVNSTDFVLYQQVSSYQASIYR